MKKAGLIGALVLVFFSVAAFAGDVFVRGYYRKDGTYVRPHIRSSPDGFKWNNYGPSRNTYELMNPWVRDYDRDGIPNYLDLDSDNDWVMDDYDASPYSGYRY